MKIFYFTFGFNHQTLKGLSMKDFYIKVEAENALIAKDLFQEQFAQPIMGDSFKWAFQYDESKFDSSCYLSGEFKFLTTKKI